MAVTLSDYHLNSYTNDTWTELASPGTGEILVIRSLTICNTSASGLDVSIRITQSDGSTVKSTQMDGYTLGAGQSLFLGPRDIMWALTSEQQLQVKADVAGASFMATGGYE